MQGFSESLMVPLNSLHQMSNDFNMLMFEFRIFLTCFLVVFKSSSQKFSVITMPGFGTLPSLGDYTNADSGCGT